MPRTLGPLAALLALLLLGFFPPPAFGQNATVKAGVCPERPAADNCTEDCLSDGDCPDTSKCCRAGCSSQCLIPNGGHERDWKSCRMGQKQQLGQKQHEEALARHLRAGKRSSEGDLPSPRWCLQAEAGLAT
ncbi:WAP four-disulfide core domain protein 2 isoform X2 [Ornithorhynchus anatinus]|nr:WAP four-disulfide core domain protein 2 isoform X2 [Ornithorhynchus anatinus]